MLLLLSPSQLLLDILLVGLHDLNASELAQIVEFYLAVALACTLRVGVVTSASSLGVTRST